LADENEDIIKAFLHTHPNFALFDIQNLWAEKIDAPYPAQSRYYLRMSPLTTATDGFFVCILTRRS
jgi:16S rRNA (cytosine967-C5)-methyltransferase